MSEKGILWMDEILHDFETMGSRCALVVTRDHSRVP